MTDFSRTERLLGSDAMEKLSKSCVAVFGVGGVGSFTAEALARSGVGHIALFDMDTVAPSNVNRQLIATTKTIDMQKVKVMSQRIKDINPDCIVEENYVFYSADTCDNYNLCKYDYVVDAIDTVASKLLLAEKCSQLGVPIISCMGAGNKLDPTAFEITDIFKTSVCPLARVMRRELKNRGIKKLKVLYSKEEPIKPVEPQNSPKENCNKRQIPGSVAFVPSVAGLIIAGEVIRDICNIGL